MVFQNVRNGATVGYKVGNAFGVALLRRISRRVVAVCQSHVWINEIESTYLDNHPKRRPYSADEAYIARRRYNIRIANEANSTNQMLRPSYVWIKSSH
jgi:hypothetical protein